jgi:hypothetical protein
LISYNVEVHIRDFGPVDEVLWSYISISSGFSFFSRVWSEKIRFPLLVFDVRYRNDSGAAEAVGRLDAELAADDR